MKAPPLISIVIPVKNDRDLLESCLGSLGELEYPGDRFEVIIADGGSSDGSAELASRMGARVVPNRKERVAPGRNRGFEAARGELIAFSDADCVMDSHWLSDMVKYFDDPALGGVGGRILLPEDQGDFGRAVDLLFASTSGITATVQTDDPSESHRVGDLAGCNCVYRRQALEKVMPIDESLLTGDDVELNRQVRRAGYHLLRVPDVKLWHHRRHTAKGLFRQMYRYSIGRLHLGRRDRQSLKAVHIGVGLSLPALALALTVTTLTRPTFAAISLALLAVTCLVIGLFGLAKLKSPISAMYLPIALVITCSAWSLGFTRELLFPQKTAHQEEPRA